ncbi:MAG: MOSC domain-containing protein [Methylococcales symbiont of Hymedesmia sp. n. MRB-2018]|nr:MAG: MOSC domain-containing protein [Methylococcales symbiont of Hymedesmia sp. n. MRB-2018]
MSGKIKYIFIATSSGEPMQSLNVASIVSGKGIEGDRYYTGLGTFSEKLKGNPAVEISLIEIEEIDKFNSNHNQQLDYGDFRRNIVTEGIKLNNLVGKIFYIGNVKLKGIRLCEPCSHLAETVNQLVLPHLVGRGGLRAQIISTNKIKIGESING